MPIEAAALKDWPHPDVKCPSCGKSLLPFMRGQVQRQKKSLMGKKQPYCAIICANCKDLIGYEDPTQALINLEHLKARDRKQAEDVMWSEKTKRRTARRKVFTEDEPDGADPSPEEQTKESVQEKGIPTMVRYAALGSASMGATGSTSGNLVCSSAAVSFTPHPQGCMCNWCWRMRARSTF
jgi:hypothetical protein